MVPAGSSRRGTGRASAVPAGGVEAAVARGLTELEALDREALAERWRRVFGGPAPARSRAELLRRALGHQLQLDLLGGPDAAQRRRLARAGRGAAADLAPPRPGTRLIREWQGEPHQVLVTEAGYQYRDRTYRSLSAIARQITGTRWSGPLFFGLRKGV